MYINTYVSTNVHKYERKKIRWYICFFLFLYSVANLRIISHTTKLFILKFISTYVFIYQRTYLLIYIHSFLPIYISI